VHYITIITRRMKSLVSFGQDNNDATVSISTSVVRAISLRRLEIFYRRVY